jgi:cysteine desulfurase
MKKIYFDHSATTPVDKKVLNEMLPCFSEDFGNASSIHSFGQAALKKVDKSREIAGKYFNCDPGEIIFTSGATESNNLILKGFVKALRKKGIKKIHIITSCIEHDAILEPCAELKKEGITISYLSVKKNGVVDIRELNKLIRPETYLVSVMYVNSEVGSIQPIREIGKIIKKINEKKLREWQKMRTKDRGEKPLPIYFHTDATQAVNFLNCDTKYLHVDYLSMSAHKIYGPKGVGLLYKRKEAPLEAIQLGGHHENNKRSGTINVSGIVGLGRAISLISDEKIKKDNQRIAELRDMLVDGVLKNVPDTILNTDRKNSTPAHAHFSFLGVEGESILIFLDLEGIAVSTGSACASGSLEASHVLLAMGIKKEVAHNSIRFSLGRKNTKEEIKKVVKVLPGIIKRMRDMNPDYSS